MLPNQHGDVTHDRKSVEQKQRSGGDFTKQFVRYRNIRVKRLDTAAK